MNFSKKILPNGIRVITAPMKDHPTVTVMVLVEAGSKYETKEISGLSHFLEHMCFKGTKKRPKASDISRELDGLGAVYNAFTGQEYTGYFAKSDKRHLNQILDVVFDLYLNPAFPEAEIEKEKGVIVEEINMYRDLPQHHVQENFSKLLYGNQPAGWSIAGTPKTVRSMKRGDFLKYRDSHYVSKATVVLVAGDIDEKEIIKEVSEKFNGISSGKKRGKVPIKEKQEKPEFLVERRKTDQTHIVIGARAAPIASLNEPTLEVLNAVLGQGMSSRLFLKLRGELGAGYYVRSSYDALTDHGVLAVSTGVDKKRVSEITGAIVAELRRFKNEKVPEKELRKAKDMIGGRLLMSLETSDERAEFFGFQEILRPKIETPKDIIKKLEAVSAENIQKTAQEFFTDNQLNMAAIGDISDKDEKEIHSALHL